MANGVLYVTEPWSVVQALDARTGKRIWRYDPEVPRDKAHDSCCDVVNRGVALWGDSVFVGALDGRLIALDARNGKLRWRAETFDPATPRTITGALTANTGANDRRLLVYKLGGKSELPESPAVVVQHPEPPQAADDAATLLRGRLLYQGNCGVCHGDSAMGNNMLPDLRFSPMLEPDTWKSVVFDGALKAKGMIGFEKFLAESDVEAIRAYVISEARKELAFKLMPRDKFANLRPGTKSRFSAP